MKAPAHALMVASLLALVGCGSLDVELDPLDAASVFVVQDLLPREPPGFTAYLHPTWQIYGTNDVEPVPPALLQELGQTSGLPTYDYAALGRDSTAILLYLSSPSPRGADSIAAYGGWMGLTHGDGGSAWGYEYSYRLRCDPKCVHLVEPGRSSWN
ncbi:MAG: hypothetical protein OEN56_10200 [Gemmatimonadota bacterium]|nr:hypothetical protein [Gemmatimonadota bacterium]